MHHELPGLREYASLIIRTGLNLQPDQGLVVRVTGQVQDAQPLVEAVTVEAYRQGASIVDVIWEDDELLRLRAQLSSISALDQRTPGWIAGVATSVSRGDALLTVHAPNPEGLADVDAERLAIIRRRQSQAYQPIRQVTGSGGTSWCVVATVSRAWADMVLPDLPESERESALWRLISGACRLDQEDPSAAWQTHTAVLARRQEQLTAQQYDALHFRAPGTDLLVGLAPNHIWLGGGTSTQAGIRFIPNLPTEEVFTLPDRERVDGVVTATMPLTISGHLVDDFSIQFKRGVVTNVSARRQQESLEKLLDTEPAARRLGEVALVPASSPIAAAGRLFFNTLYDENASSHLALGNGYRISMRHGEKMTEEEFTTAGGNISIIHTDFMIGSAQMQVDGIKVDGEREALMRDGEWLNKA